MRIVLLFIAEYLYLFVGLIAFVVWLRAPRPEKIRLAVFGVIAAAVTFALIKIGAAVYYDPRPFVAQNVVPLFKHAADNGFPSDHTALTAFIGLTIFTAWRRIGLLLLLMSVMIGSARVIGNIHSPIDIIGSLAFALVGFAVACAATPYILKRLKRADEHIQAD